MSCKDLATVQYCMPPDDGRMTETCCGNKIRRGREKVLHWLTHNCFVNNIRSYRHLQILFWKDFLQTLHWFKLRSHIIRFAAIVLTHLARLYIYIQGDSQSFTPAYGTYSWGYFLQNFLINLWSIFNSYRVTLDFRNAALWMQRYAHPPGWLYLPVSWVSR
jgi:hypothetical protein